MHPPSQLFIEGVERVRPTTPNVLGVLLNARLSMTDHGSQVLNTCSSSIFALRLLRTHVILMTTVHDSNRKSSTVSSILYATQAWWGVCGEGDRLSLERLIARMRRRGYLPSDSPNIESLAGEAERRLFESIKVKGKGSPILDFERRARCLSPVLGHRRQVARSFRRTQGCLRSETATNFSPAI